MIVKLLLTKTFEVDLTKPHNEAMLREALSDTDHPKGVLSPEEIHDTIREILAYDLDGALIELSDIDANDFKIEVPDDATFDYTPDQPESD